MPYRVSGNTVLVKKGGRWIKKATAKSKAAAGRMVKLLRGLKAKTIRRKRKARKK